MRRHGARVRHRSVERGDDDVGRGMCARGPGRRRRARGRNHRRRRVQAVAAGADRRLPRHRRPVRGLRRGHRAGRRQAAGAGRLRQDARRPRRAHRPKGPSVPEVLQTWARRNKCTGQASEKQVASDVTELTYTCPPGAEVELYRVQGGGHSWPGSAFSKSVGSVVGPTTESISANDDHVGLLPGPPAPRLTQQTSACIRSATGPRRRRAPVR